MPMISLNKIAKINVFKVPNNYFEELTVSILKQTQNESQTNTSSQKQKAPFATPNGYFEGLSAKIMGRIEQIEKKNIDLESFERVNVFKVQEGYFESLSKKTISNATPKQAKTIKVNWWKNQQIRWSAAASIILMVGLWFGIPQFTKDKTELVLEKVSHTEIKTYLETQDLSYLEYESTTETTQNPIKITDNKVLDGLNIDKQAILEHLETQDLEEDI